MTYKLLIVDDEPANLRVLERLFASNFEVFTATSGEDGLEVLSAHDIALIISDQRMPGMNGVEFLKKAAALRTSTVRMILTGYTDIDALVESINSGVVYRYITKPWSNPDLQQTVKRALEFYEARKNRHALEQENLRMQHRAKATVRGIHQPRARDDGYQESSHQRACTSDREIRDGAWQGAELRRGRA